MYFITINVQDKRQILQSTRVADLLLSVLSSYQQGKKYALHEYVIMPDHLHVLLTPAHNVTLEKVVQLIKGGFSFRAKRELGFRGTIWQESYHDRRVRNDEEYEAFCRYIHQNPVKRGLVASPEEYRYSSACVPQWLKPPCARA